MEFFIIFIFIFFICLFFYSIQHLQKAWYYWLTFGFLPMGLHIRKGTNIHSWRVPILGPLLNYATACCVNLIDSWLWLWLWLPGMKKFTLSVYRSPDTLERYLGFIFGGINGHRNFISHSVFNPVFLLIVWFFGKMIALSPIRLLQIPLQLIGTTLCLSFIAHLLADTLPKAWLGKALIKVFFLFHFTTLSIKNSKLWLHLNVIFCFFWFTFNFQLWPLTEFFY
ncbi:MAG: hypothetical protein ACRCZC_05050 [Culicoidibacterales bacterium]